ncbi:MAG: UDP-N-acetylglucosamine diphosphorylase [Puniceicoccales bacterium]|jgi:NDP-sugar pyrophosphorylase family protein|nr:UDP-N-acetylglucosamine diphosphorylase [Puniceicoccales bacterium]
MVFLAKDFFGGLGSLDFLREFFPEDIHPWEWVKVIAQALESLECGRDGIFVDPSSRIARTATLMGSVYVGPGTEVRPGACVRGFAIIGKNCVIGNGSEIKNSLICDDAQIAHFNYVGDSIVGNNSHMGAGAILSNLRFDEGEIIINGNGEKFSSGLRKFGAILGDGSQVGCNAVLQPGTIIGRHSIVRSGISFGGYLPPRCTVRHKMEWEICPPKG